MREYTDYSLLKHNTFGIDARCSRFVEFETEEEAADVARRYGTSAGPVLVVGGGSNLLLTHDYQGTVLHSAIKGHEVQECADGSVLLRVGSGEVWDDVVALCVERGWHGAENLSLIPGEVGASAIQNIGAYGAEACDIIYKVEVVEMGTGVCHSFDNAECCYGYRQSRFKQDWRGRFLVTHVTYRLSRHFEPRLDYGNIRAELEHRGIASPTPQQLRQTIIAIRQQKLPDPAVQGNAGSFFMNPVVDRQVYERLLLLHPQMPHYRVDEQHEKIPAGWLIEQCGWKGRSMGRAGVHDRQALVLVNRGGATGQEIIDLCHRVCADVKERFGIDLHPEVNIC